MTRPQLRLISSVNAPIGATHSVQVCRWCGIQSRKPEHLRCRQLVQKRKQYAEQAELARHMAEVAGEFVRARL